MFGCKAKVGLNTSNLLIEFIDNLVTDEDLENVEQEMNDAINAATFFANESAAMPTETSECPDQLSDNKSAKKFCVVCQQECSSAHSCESCGKVVHAICRISNEADERRKNICSLCHNKQEIPNKRSAAHASLQTH